MSKVYTSAVEVVADMKADAISVEDGLAIIAELNAAKELRSKKLTLKVSPKTGALCLYGLNKGWPTTLYKQQWLKVSEFMPTILQFIKDHDSELSTKAKPGVKDETPPTDQKSEEQPVDETDKALAELDALGGDVDENGLPVALKKAA